MLDKQSIKKLNERVDSNNRLEFDRKADMKGRFETLPEIKNESINSEFELLDSLAMTRTGKKYKELKE